MSGKRHGCCTLQALYQPQGGILNSEEGIRAHTRAAQKHGAILHTGERVQRWQVLPSGKVEVITNKATYTAGRLVLTAGAWMPSPELVPELRVWFPCTAEHLLVPICLETIHCISDTLSHLAWCSSLGVS